MRAIKLSTEPKVTPKAPVLTVVTYREPAWYGVVATLCLSLGIIGLRIVDDSTAWNQIVDQSILAIPLGTVTREAGGVRRRPPSSLVWFDIPDRGLTISEGDTVSTNATGIAVLHMDDGSTVRILADSLVELHGPSKKQTESSWFRKVLKPLLGVRPDLTKVQVQKGTIAVELKKDAGLDIGLKDQTLHVVPQTDAGDLRVAINPLDPNAPASLTAGAGAKLSIVNTDGNGNVNSVTPLNLEAGRALWVARGESPSIVVSNYKALTPHDGEVINPKTSDRAKVDTKFRWDWANEGKPTAGQGARLEITGATSQTVTVQNGEKHAQVALGGGNYRWRVSTEDSKTGQWGQTPWTAFSVNLQNSPEVLGPVSGYETSVEKSNGGKASVSLIWTPVRDAFATEVELTPIGEGRKFTVKGGPSGTEVSLRAGRYTWHVRATRGRFVTPWSETRHLTIHDGDITPAEAAVALVKPAAVKGVVPSNAATTVQTTALKTEKPIPAKVPVIPPLPATKDPATTVPGKITSAIAHGQVRFDASGENGEYFTKLSWSALPGAKTYSVRIITSDNTSVAVKETTTTQLEWVSATFPNSTYFYEVTALDVKDASGKAVQSPRMPIQSEIAAPQTKMPAAGEVQKVGKKIFMTWDRTPLTEDYRLQISTDGHFLNLTSDEKLDRNLKVIETLPVGTYYWRVRAATHGTQSPWSEARRFDVQN